MPPLHGLRKVNPAVFESWPHQTALAKADEIRVVWCKLGTYHCRRRQCAYSLRAGEPSGDMHGANLIRSLRQRDPGVDIAGFGGDFMREAGCDVIFPLCDFAVVGIIKVLTSLSHFAAILEKADRFFRRHRPDALVMIDFPGFHWWLAKAAKARGIPVVYFVPPQIWAWATWRHRKCAV